MEGREQKHQQIKKYIKNTTVQNKWRYIFRHEYVQLIYLRENGYDTVKYRHSQQRYVPKPVEGCCSICGLEISGEDCELCDSVDMKNVRSDLQRKMNKKKK